MESHRSSISHCFPGPALMIRSDIKRDISCARKFWKWCWDIKIRYSVYCSFAMSLYIGLIPYTHIFFLSYVINIYFLFVLYLFVINFVLNCFLVLIDWNIFSSKTSFDKSFFVKNKFSCKCFVFRYIQDCFKICPASWFFPKCLPSWRTTLKFRNALEKVKPFCRSFQAFKILQSLIKKLFQYSITSSAINNFGYSPV